MRRVLMVGAMVLLLALAFGGGYVMSQQSKANESSETKKPATNEAEDNQAVQPDTTYNGPLPLYYVAINDNGKFGDRFGCDDSIIPVLTDNVTTDDRLTEALTRLLADESQRVEGTELYNALYQADLTLVRAEVEDNVAVVELRGDLNLRGTCDTPRVEEQLERTALAASGANDVRITLNDEPLAEALSLQ